MLRAWLAFFFASFVVSLFALSVVQTAARARFGSWRAVRARPFLDTYWRDLSASARLFVWVGLVAFGLTMLGAAVTSLFQR